MITTVVFDVGETLVNEERHWSEWADHLGVTRFAFFAAMGAVIERGEHHRRVFDVVRPGLDIDAETARRRAAGWTYRFETSDFYPDAFHCLRAVRAAGYAIGVAGNQPDEAEAALERVGIAADFIASSAHWGVEKPSRGFFDRVVAAAGVPVAQIAYVGDRLDNDVLPARDAGMTAVFIRRGPWGFIHATRPEAALAHVRLESLEGLLPALAKLG